MNDLRFPVEDALDERRVVGSSAGGDVAVELRTRLAGDDDARVWGWRGVQCSDHREQQGGEGGEGGEGDEGEFHVR